jgi:hypothetical protein
MTTPDINEILRADPVNCSRGAPMGQANLHCAKGALHLQMVRTPDGYSADGTYWGLPGLGGYLYCAFNGDDDQEFAAAMGTRLFVRAHTRAGAKLELFKHYRGLTFKR